MDAAAMDHAAAQSIAQRAPSGSTAAIDAATAQLHDLTFRHGECYDSYLATAPGRMIFWDGDGQGLISYVRRGRHVLVGGGLIAAADRKEQLLREFLDGTSRERLRVVFHNISNDDLPLFRKLGFQVTKWGEEPIIDLTTCTWSGKAFEWVRRQSNYCLRQGLTSFEVVPESLAPYQWSRLVAELLEVSAQTLEGKPQAREMQFYVGQIASHALGLRRLFVARGDNGAGRIEGFLVCNPMHNGTAWAAEIFRHRTDSVRGTIAFLIHQTARQLQTEGVRELSLCLVAGQNCDRPLPGDSFLIRRGLQVMRYGFGWAYDVAGMSHFKSRFRPGNHDRYLCVLPKVTVGSICAMIGEFGALNLDYGKVLRILVSRIKKRSLRSTLAQI